MRKKIVAGNWKMNKTVAEAQQLVSELIPGLDLVKGIDRVLCPPFTALHPIGEMLKSTGIGLGAQNLYWENAGAYTAEVSPTMVAELCQYVIIGHSERRQYFGETDKMVNKRVKAALEIGLNPIVCIGETLEENQAGKTVEVVARQVHGGLADLTPEQGSKLVIAYEPVWAIGTGLAATPDDANKIHGNVVRKSLSNLFGEDVAQGIRIQYGGSVKPDNAADYFAQSDIDGALVGGASLKAEPFIAIAEAAA
ncbi:triose-phosphate isomerase [Chloroflexota bacterium]